MASVAGIYLHADNRNNDSTAYRGPEEAAQAVVEFPVSSFQSYLKDSGSTGIRSYK